MELFASKFDGSRVLRVGILAAERVSYRFASHVLTVHEPYAHKLRALTRKPVTVVMNCPDERVFRPRPWVGWHCGSGVAFGYHGLLAIRHGLVQAIEALALVRQTLPLASLRLWGNGDGLNELHAAVTRLGLSQGVVLPGGPVPLDRMAEELRSIHIGLIPSLSDAWTDGVLPTKLLEYAALGIPVITFRNPVIETYFSEECVTYVDPVTPGNLAAAMCLLATDGERARRQATRARQAMRRLAWRTEKQTYLTFLGAVARRGKHPR
ncbi:MAG TPA: glycosyltransferase [Candidatus Limnocylindrales bacterium]|nr:glycosyltransferase [Candidatus Limnocylindrales bacterium]